jgi:hypothetical protein
MAIGDGLKGSRLAEHFIAITRKNMVGISLRTLVIRSPIINKEAKITPPTQYQSLQRSKPSCPAYSNTIQINQVVRQHYKNAPAT